MTNIWDTLYRNGRLCKLKGPDVNWVRNNETGVMAVNVLHEMGTRPFKGTGVFQARPLIKPFRISNAFYEYESSIKKNIATGENNLVRAT